MRLFHYLTLKEVCPPLLGGEVKEIVRKVTNTNKLFFYKIGCQTSTGKHSSTTIMGEEEEQFETLTASCTKGIGRKQLFFFQMRSVQPQDSLSQQV